MAQSFGTPLQLNDIVRSAADGKADRVSAMAKGLIGSEILKIAAQVREKIAAGIDVCNFTVGDFSPAQFRVPDELAGAVTRAIADGQTNYPPSTGVLELRNAVLGLYRRRLGLDFPLESVLIAGGARPLIYGTYRALVDPGDEVIYPVPSWNNNHYCHMVGAKPVPLACTPEDRFMPTRKALTEVISSARLMCINSPLNPTGTAIEEQVLADICQAIVDENKRRERDQERPLYLLYDHIYWMLCMGGTEHVTPPALVPEVARYTVMIDGISKAFAATGMRVGWAAGPVDVMAKMSAILGHVGAWAPRPEQLATVSLLDDDAAVDGYLARFKPAVQSRLNQLHEGISAMQADGLPVMSIPPMGAIYLTVRIHPFGHRTGAGEVLKTNEQVRHYLLERANVAIVPFQAFGMAEDSGWFRFSVGAVGQDDITRALPRLAGALRELTPQ